MECTLIVNYLFFYLCALHYHHACLQQPNKTFSLNNADPYNTNQPIPNKICSNQVASTKPRSSQLT